MIVDAHAHVFLSAGERPRTVEELVPCERRAPAEELLAAMDAAGVGRAVLVPLDADDRYVAAAAAARPDRFVPSAVAGRDEYGLVPGVDPVVALEGHRERSPFAALRLRWLGDPAQPLAESPALPALRWLAASDLVAWSYLPPEQLPLLLELPREVPELRVVLNHLGFFPQAMQVDPHGRPAFADPLPPQRVEAVLGLARHPRFHMMISGQYALSAQPYPHRDLDPLVRRMVDAFGPERCLWGSDFPWIERVPGYAETLALLESALPEAGPEDLAAIRGGTVQRLLPALAAEARR